MTHYTDALRRNDVAIIRFPTSGDPYITWHTAQEWRNMMQAVETGDHVNDDGLLDLERHHSMFCRRDVTYFRGLYRRRHHEAGANRAAKLLNQTLRDEREL